VEAVIVESYERIHRSNLVMMGILPLTYRPGETAASLGLDGTETFDIAVTDDLLPRAEIPIVAHRADGSTIEFTAIARVDAPIEIEYLRHGGILHMVLRDMAARHATGD
jgi:aconitate hydratase